MTNNEVIEKNNGRRFDVCLMNPPYDKNTHLKFVQKTVQLSRFTICIEPIDKFVSPKLVYNPYSIKEYKKYEDTLKHCMSVEQIDATEFKITIQNEVGITTWSYEEQKDWTASKFVPYSDDEKALIRKIMGKVRQEGDDNNLIYFLRHRKDDLGNIYQYIPALHGNVNQNGTKCADFYEIFSRDYKKAITVKKNYEGSELRFKTEEERKNYIDSTFLEAHKKIMSFWKTDMTLRLECIPWLHKYDKPWTNEMIMNFYDLTNEEKETFENIKLKY